MRRSSLLVVAPSLVCACPLEHHHLAHTLCARSIIQFTFCPMWLDGGAWVGLCAGWASSSRRGRLLAFVVVACRTPTGSARQPEKESSERGSAAFCGLPGQPRPIHPKTHPMFSNRSEPPPTGSHMDQPTRPRPSASHLRPRRREQQCPSGGESSNSSGGGMGLGRKVSAAMCCCCGGGG